MKETVFAKLEERGFQGDASSSAQDAIQWLSQANILRIEPYWRFLGSVPGFSWSKSWEEYSDKIEVNCATWEELLEIALEQSVEQAL